MIGGLGLAQAQPAKKLRRRHLRAVGRVRRPRRPGSPYVQGLAKAIEQNTGIKTEAQSYGSIGALKSDNVDFAIIDGPCYAVNLGLRLLANANIGGGVSRDLGAVLERGDSMQALKGKKLAFVATGCNDAGFVDNAMFESEVDAQFFGARVGEKDLDRRDRRRVVVQDRAGRVRAGRCGPRAHEAVRHRCGAEPRVRRSSRRSFPAAVSAKVSAAVVGFGGSGAIAGWAKPSREPFTSLAGPARPRRQDRHPREPRAGEDRRPRRR